MTNIFFLRIFFPRIFFPRIFSARIFSARIFFPRFFSTLALASIAIFLVIFLAIFFAVAVILSFSPEAKASEHEVKAGSEVAGNEVIEKEAAPEEAKDKVERKLERAQRLKEKGKLRKATKVLSKALRTEYKAQRKYQRALELKRRGKFKKYGKKIRRSARLGSEDAQAIMDSLDATSAEDAAAADTSSKEEAYALVGEIEEMISANPAISGARRGDADALYAIGSMYLAGGQESGGAKNSVPESSMPESSMSGVEQNLSVAFAMFLHAEKLGSGRASNDLSLLLPALSTAEVDVGRDVYKEWRSIMRKEDKKASKEDKK